MRKRAIDVYIILLDISEIKKYTAVLSAIDRKTVSISHERCLKLSAEYENEQTELLKQIKVLKMKQVI